MNSWMLFRYLPHLWGSPPVESPAGEPLALRERLRPPPWQRLFRRYQPRMVVLGALVIAIGHVALMLAAPPNVATWALLSGTCVAGWLVALLPSAGLWVLPFGVTLGPLVARERERATWDLLRLTPLSTGQILLGKLHGTFFWLHDVMRLWQLMLLMEAMGVALFSVERIEALPTDTLANDLLLNLLPALLGVIFAVDRLQQLVLMIAATLAASAGQSSVRGGVVLGTGAAFAAWMVELIWGGVLIGWLPQVTIYSGVSALFGLLAFGPVGGLVAHAALPDVLLWGVVTLLLRELIIRTLWPVVLHGAREGGQAGPI